MEIKVFDILGAGLFFTAGVAPALPDRSVCIKNDRYQLTAVNETKVVMEGVENATAAPSLFRRAEEGYLLGSGSDGWAPNAARLFVANHLTGPYQSLGNPCRDANPHNQLEVRLGGQSTVKCV
jgi:hypothetical protein